MKILKWWPAFALVLVLANVRSAHADTEIDGSATSSTSFTLSGSVVISTLSAANLSVSTITVVSSATITNLTVTDMNISMLTVSTMTVSSATIANATIGKTTTNAVGYMIGTVVQQVQQVDSSMYSTTSTSYQAASTLGITPKASTDKIRVTITGTAGNLTATNAELLTIFSGSTSSALTTNLGGSGNVLVIPSGSSLYSPFSMTTLDSLLQVNRNCTSSVF